MMNSASSQQQFQRLTVRGPVKDTHEDPEEQGLEVPQDDIVSCLATKVVVVGGGVSSLALAVYGARVCRVSTQLPCSVRKTLTKVTVGMSLALAYTEIPKADMASTRKEAVKCIKEAKEGTVGYAVKE